MNKTYINKILSRFGLELNGLSYMQSLRKSVNDIDVFLKKRELLDRDVKVIFDVGANSGELAMKYNTVFPDAEIYCFEPFPGKFYELSKKFKQNNKMHLVNEAVSNINGEQTFYINNNVDTNSLLKSQAIGLRSDHQVKNEKQILVKTVTLNEFCKQYGISSIDILKMDIQGGELDALKGSDILLKGKNIRLIYTEMYFVPQYVNQPLFLDIMGYLDKMDYQLQDIYNPIYGKGSIAWCDAIFLPR